MKVSELEVQDVGMDQASQRSCVAQDPEGSSKIDLVKAAVAVEAPAGQTQNPFGTLLNSFTCKSSSADTIKVPSSPSPAFRACRFSVLTFPDHLAP